MASRLSTVLVALAVTPLAVACSDGGTATPGTTTPGSEASAFDNYFGLGGGRSANDSGATAQEGCADDNCTTDPNAPMPVYVPPVCESPLAPPAGALAACQTFCAKVTACAGEPAATAACASDCAASLAGTELAAAQQIFGCFTAASCDDIANWGGGGGDTTEPSDPRTDVPSTDPAGPDAGGGSESPAPEEGSDPLPPREGGGEVVVAANPIGACVDAVFMSWADGTLPAAKQAVCDAVPANVERCDVGDTAVVSSGGGQASSGSPPDGGSDGSSPSEPAQIPREDPIEPEEEQASYDDDDAAECRALGALLSQQTFARIGACDALADCDARDACLEQVLVCAPFIEIIYFGGGSASTTVDVVEPRSTDSGEGSASSGGTDPAETPPPR
ncbi:MAG: hypothetical protein CVU56_17165 [Deltaproteobacteria bacterium HGW-Deltaproteobacteria-14]|jgi:hypothetical protein|nr:MAG: hypothetical protein CVU56_17165 [Deltaproteobacteria bacterium HGW-Deltaproteobacteria-14]